MLYSRILEALTDAPHGLAAWEIARLLKHKGGRQGPAPRLSELEDEGLVYRPSNRQPRVNPVSGRKCAVYMRVRHGGS